MGSLRKPKTTQERKQAQGVRVRAKRNTKNLPNSYDDEPVGDQVVRSWKKRRKRKYRTITKQ